MSFFDKIFGKKKISEIDADQKENSSPSNDDSKRELSFSIKYFIKWKPKAKHKDWLKTKCCYLEESGERYKPLCKRLYDLDRIYTRAEIESMSLRLGYSVYDSPGGSDDCCCYWESEVFAERK
jgi:hypothetical protein